MQLLPVWWHSVAMDPLPPLLDEWELRERLRAELAINLARLSETRRELESIVREAREALERSHIVLAQARRRPFHTFPPRGS